MTLGRVDLRTGRQRSAARRSMRPGRGWPVSSESRWVVLGDPHRADPYGRPAGRAPFSVPAQRHPGREREEGHRSEHHRAAVVVGGGVDLDEIEGGDLRVRPDQPCGG